MRRCHHIGISATESKRGETHLKLLKLFVVSHQKSKFGVERMRFEADAPVPDLVRALAAYKDFFTLWKDADPDIPILKEARAEYARLR